MVPATSKISSARNPDKLAAAEEVSWRQDYSDTLLPLRNDVHEEKENMAALAIAMTTVSCRQSAAPGPVFLKSEMQRHHHRIVHAVRSPPPNFAKAFIKLHSKCSTGHRHDEIVIMSTGCN